MTTDQDVTRALRLAGAFGWVSSTGLGLDTPIGERGAGLSGGQLQTLAIARTLLGGPEILLFDEPTSNLDGRSEAAFAARLNKLTPRPATITVTHRPALIDAADRLMVMDAGRVVMDGPRAQVMRQLRQAVGEKSTAVSTPKVA